MPFPRLHPANLDNQYVSCRYLELCPNPTSFGEISRARRHLDRVIDQPASDSWIDVSQVRRCESAIADGKIRTIESSPALNPILAVHGRVYPKDELLPRT